MNLKEKSKCLIRKDNSRVSNDGSQTGIQVSTVRIVILCALLTLCYSPTIVSRDMVCTQYFINRFMEHNFTTNLQDSNNNNNNSSSNYTNDIGDYLMNKAEARSSDIILYNSIVVGICSALTCLYVGSVSDYLGRRVLLLFAATGSLLATLLVCIIIQFHLDVQIIFLSSVIDGLCGSIGAFLIGLLTIITDVTPGEHDRAVRLALFNLMLAFFGALSQISFGYLIAATGFLIPMLVLACLLLIALLLIIFVLPETSTRKSDFTFNIWIHIKKTSSFYISGDDIRRRLKAIIGLVGFLTLLLVIMNSEPVETLFMINKPLKWNSIHIGIFKGVRIVVQTLATVIIMRICKRRLSFELIGMIGCISLIASLTLMSFTVSTLMMYMVIILGLAGDSPYLISQLILLGIVSHDEQGALLSSLSCVQAISKVLSAILLTRIYNATLETFRGTVFLCMAGFCTATLVFFGVFRHLRITDQARKQNLLNDETRSENDNKSINGQK